MVKLLELHDLYKPGSLKDLKRNIEKLAVLRKDNIGQLKEKLSDDEFAFIITIVVDDPIGLFLQQKEITETSIESYASQLFDMYQKIILIPTYSNLSNDEFLRVMLTYYKCDAGSYTAASWHKGTFSSGTFNFVQQVQTKIDQLIDGFKAKLLS